jgi:ArsR family transcriptional regulator
MEQTELFQILSDSTRLRALALMADQGELCVCELVSALELSQPKISRHLGAMRDSGLVLSRRDAQWVFYGLNPNLPDWQQQVLAGALAGLALDSQISRDKQRLAQMQDRPERCEA